MPQKPQRGGPPRVKVRTLGQRAHIRAEKGLLPNFFLILLKYKLSHQVIFLLCPGKPGFRPAQLPEFSLEDSSWLETRNLVIFLRFYQLMAILGLCFRKQSSSPGAVGEWRQKCGFDNIYGSVGHHEMSKGKILPYL